MLDKSVYNILLDITMMEAVWSKAFFTQKYICLYLVQGSPEVLKDERVQYWIESYRNLLDAWRFWHKRAEFDIHRSKLDPSSKPLAQVRLSAKGKMF